MHNGIAAGGFVFQVDQSGNLTAIRGEKSEFTLPVACTYFDVDGQSLPLSFDSASGDAFSYRPLEISRQRAASLRSLEKMPRFAPDVRVSFSKDDSWHEEIAIRVSPGASLGEPDQDAYGFTPITETSRAGMTLYVPDTAKIHLAEHKNIGRLLDRDMALEGEYACRLEYNLAMIELDGLALRLRMDTMDLNSASIRVRRHKETFAITFAWPCRGRALLAAFGSYGEAMDDFAQWVAKGAGLRKLKDREDAPSWLRDIQVVMVIDMMLSNGVAFHTYADVVRLAQAMRGHIDPRKVLFYLPGWQGPYDGHQPAYKPAEGLGGAEGFSAMTAALREMGYRTMLHACIWGIDPYDGNAPMWEKHTTYRNGKLKAWQITTENPARMTHARFRTGKIPLPDGNAKNCKAALGYIPGDCYAYLTMGGLGGFKGRIDLTIGGWTIQAPPDGGKELYDFTYPLYCPPGDTEITIAAEGDALPPGAWIQIRDTTTYTDPYCSWTYPMLWADPNDQYYADVMAENLRVITERYPIDAIHFDAGSYRDEPKIVDTVKKALPQSVALGCEWYTTWAELDYWVLAQKACTDLVLESYPQNIILEQASAPMLAGTPEFFSWMDKASPICDFVKEYIVFYPHLVAANAFVPTRKVSNIAPERKVPQRDEELWRVVRGSGRLGYCAGLRVNYGSYGLDGKTAQALREINARPPRG